MYIYIYIYIYKHLPILHSDTNQSICTVFKRNRNLKEILSPSLYNKRKNDKKIKIIKNCGKCDICKKF